MVSNREHTSPYVLLHMRGCHDKGNNTMLYNNQKKFVGPGTTVKAPARNIKSTEKINISLVQITTLQPCFG